MRIIERWERIHKAPWARWSDDQRRDMLSSLTPGDLGSCDPLDELGPIFEMSTGNEMALQYGARLALLLAVTLLGEYIKAHAFSPLEGDVPLPNFTQGGKT
jgi:hypothetical protein